MSKMSISLKLDFRIISIVLLVIIVVMLWVWKPWASTGTRTIDVTGETTISARPDEFVFYPSYESKNSSKQAALDQLGAKTETVVSELKKLGVKDSDIKTTASGYEAVGVDDTRLPTYSTQLTITITNEDLAQKVQDYLVTTEPTGSVTPQAGFTDKTRKELERKARSAATKDARAKALEMAEDLGFRIGKVKTITDNGGLGGSPVPLTYSSVDAVELKSANFTVQPGENDIPYSVTVVYYIK